MEQDNTIETNGQQESRQDQGQGSTPTPASDFKAPGSQSELDSMINKAVQTALNNRDKGEQERTAQAVADALQKEKDYANLSAQDRAKKEFEDFEKERAAFEHEKLVVAVEKDLVAKGLPSALAETFAMAGNAEDALKAVTEFETVFNNAVAEEVKKTVRQNAPQASADGISNTDNYGSRLAQKAVRSSGKII